MEHNDAFDALLTGLPVDEKEAKMLVDGISATPLPHRFPYAAFINSLCKKYSFFPCLVGAIKINETGMASGPAEESIVSSDDGHGIMQLTSSPWPSNWTDPVANIEYAITKYLIPAYNEWRGELQGDDLIRAIAATYNAGYGGALRGHQRGDIDRYTTNRYAARALSHYHDLLARA